MRIRKNSKVSPLLFTSTLPAPEDLQPHVCVLNQSPWDVISFGSDSNQFDGEESFYGSFGESTGAVESVASMMDIGNKDKAAEMLEAVKVDEPILEKTPNSTAAAVLEEQSHKEEEEEEKNYQQEEEDEDETTAFCQKNDGKGWHCKKMAKPGYYFCNHHLSLLRSNSNGHGRIHNTNGSIHKAPGAASRPVSAVARHTRGKGKRGRGSSLPSYNPNPYQFYYYSGFGPRWGRKRGGGGREEAKNKAEYKVVDTNINATQLTPQSFASPSRIASEKFDYVDDFDDDDDEEEEYGGRKRMRKPVKARSLKSLM